MKTIRVPVRQDKALREAAAQPARRITHIKPWPRWVVEKACGKIGNEWDKAGAAATRAQGAPDFNG